MQEVVTRAPLSSIERLEALDWERIEATLFAEGAIVEPGVLTAQQCAGLRASYERPELFRSRVVMARHNFGSGEYQYFAKPVPEFVRVLREETYRRLAPVANRWMEALSLPQRFPPTHRELLDECFAHGQRPPTALLLKYGPGDYNRLHQDLYGEVAFPFQLTFFLSAPDRDYTGGEFVLVEQRPRTQSRAEVFRPACGDMLVFPNRYRPEPGPNGPRRTTFRHGVSTVRSGERYTLGLIFHDAR